MDHYKLLKDNAFRSRAAFLLVIFGDIVFLHCLIISLIDKNYLPGALISALTVIGFSLSIKPFYNTISISDKIIEKLEHPQTKLN